MQEFKLEDIIQPHEILRAFTDLGLSFDVDAQTVTINSTGKIIQLGWHTYRACGDCRLIQSLSEAGEDPISWHIDVNELNIHEVHKFEDVIGFMKFVGPWLIKLATQIAGTTTAPVRGENYGPN